MISVNETIVRVVADDSKVNVSVLSEQTKVVKVGAVISIATPVQLHKTAGTALSGHKAVCVKSDGKAYYADTSDSSTQGVLGISTGAAVLNALVSIQTQGELQHNGWDWAISEPVFVGANGGLTQSVIGTAYIQCVGMATASNTINIDIHPIILL